MKKIISILLIVSSLSSCGLFHTDRIRKDGASGLLVKAVKKYLLLPAEDNGAEIKVSITADGKDGDCLVMRLAQTRIDYWIPVDLSAWKGRQVRLQFENLPSSALCWEKARLSDHTDGLYREPYRPVYHFSPEFGWMNDPNGMVWYDGVYHLCYQHNPYGTRWQNMHWGHAVSNDLVTWEHRPEALAPDSLGTIFSGCTVVDENNTAGLQTGPEKTLLAFFTHSERHGQFQSLAYSTDKGNTWKKYENNPILTHKTARDFRDPKVFWYAPGQKWIMILAVGQKMEIYSSADALKWTWESEFGEGQGEHGGVWECPDLFELPVEGTPGLSKWILLCNMNPGGPSGGSATQYFIGTFDGHTFRNESDPRQVRWLDWGKDHYAAVSWAGISPADGRHIVIGWMSNWQYANDVPTQNFRNALTVPRELKLVRTGRDLRVTSYPVREVEKLRSNLRKFDPITVREGYYIDDLLTDNSGAYEINLTIRNCSAEILGFRLYNTRGECIDISVNTIEEKLIFDRRNSGCTGFSPDFPAATQAPLRKKQHYELRLLFDKASVECFEGAGEIAMTNLIFPSEPYNRINFYGKGGEYTLENFQINKLNN